ncbi:MAG: efflux RND transporter periplasmic adaptor subunit, partial [Phycisphaerae bacterium]|nr:efflux RND transporter periplasmic adaptor subunit [Phycisphaerae bacterium]
GGDIGYSPQEIEEARITMEVAELKVREARQKKQQAQAIYERQATKVELMDLVSLIDGIVEKVNVDAGEMADPQKPEGAISVVKNDPVWVEVALLETWQAARLRPGQELLVRYTIDKPDAWQKARVIYVAPVADASSAKQAIRLEMPNPEGRASGLEVEVKLPAELTVSPLEKTAANN